MKKNISNETKSFAKAVKEMIKMYMNSYNEETDEYKLDMETCAYKAAKNNGLGDGLWYILVLASGIVDDKYICYEDLEDWANSPEEFINFKVRKPFDPQSCELFGG